MKREASFPASDIAVFTSGLSAALRLSISMIVFSNLVHMRTPAVATASSDLTLTLYNPGPHGMRYRDLPRAPTLVPV